MADSLPRVQFGDAGLNLVELPIFRFDECGNCLCSEKRFGALRSLGKGVQALLGFGIDSDRKGLCHVRYLLVTHWHISAHAARQSIIGKGRGPSAADWGNS